MDTKEFNNNPEANEYVENLIANDLKPPKNRTHTILTIVALFIIVLMSTIIATKIILDDSLKDENILQDPDSIRDPDLIVDETKKQEENETLKPETKSIYDIASYVVVSFVGIDNEEATSIMDVEKSNDGANEENKTSSTETNTNDTPPSKERDPLPTEEPKPKTNAVPTTPDGSYYIQVGSFVEKPGERFLNIIKSNGYRYIIKEQGGNKKLLIGGYESKNQAAKALIDIKDKINKNAFITR
jgi:cell division septation protein DedD